MTNVYVVYGNSGDMNDMYEWVYSVYQTESEADLVCEALNNRLANLKTAQVDEEEVVGIMLGIDENFSVCDYNTCQYYYDEAPFGKVPPE